MEISPKKSAIGFFILAALGTLFYLSASNLSFAASINRGRKPDLKVVPVFSGSTSVPSALTIKNVGNAPAAPFWYQTIWVPPDSESCLDGCNPPPIVRLGAHTSSLAPGASVNIEATGDATFDYTGAVAVSIDPNNRIREKNERNNTFIWFDEMPNGDPAAPEEDPVLPPTPPVSIPPASSSESPTITPVFDFNTTLQYGKDKKVGGWLLNAPANQDYRVDALCLKFQGTLPVSNITRLKLLNARNKNTVWATEGTPAFLDNKACFTFADSNYRSFMVSSAVEPVSLELFADLTASSSISSATIQSGLGQMEYAIGSNAGRVSDFSFSSTYSMP